MSLEIVFKMNILKIGFKVYWIWLFLINFACVFALDSFSLVTIVYFSLCPMVYFAAGIFTRRFDFYFMNLGVRPSHLFFKLVLIYFPFILLQLFLYQYLKGMLYA